MSDEIFLCLFCNHIYSIFFNKWKNIHILRKLYHLLSAHTLNRLNFKGAAFARCLCSKSARNFTWGLVVRLSTGSEQIQLTFVGSHAIQTETFLPNFRPAVPVWKWFMSCSLVTVLQWSGASISKMLGRWLFRSKHQVRKLRTLLCRVEPTETYI